ncbi:PIN domain-containing protein [Nocardia sp. NPDC005978]|uniref:PIN domain-containing protein n=1 Tax=Nocardia sp. NPDC005978 TaxID=3156725 RepID=UPI0033B82C18
MASGRVQRVLADANILYSRTLRDWVCLLHQHSEGSMFTVCWTEDIMAETVYHLRKKNPHYGDHQVGGTRRRIVGALGEHNAITGYSIDKTCSYPDLFDAHVHCAAIHGRVDILLTADTEGFKFDNLDELPYEVYSADDYFQLVDDSQPEVVAAVMEEQLRYWVPKKGKSLPEALRAAQAPGFAERIRLYLQSADIERILSAEDDF